ncbi:hypothetical protein B566_EDAN013418, partial [Ephemera danica]
LFRSPLYNDLIRRHIDSCHILASIIYKKEATWQPSFPHHEKIFASFQLQFYLLLFYKGEYRNEEHTLISGKKIKLSYVNKKFTLKCINSLTIKAGSGLCTPIGVLETKNPVCRQPGNKGHTTPRLPGGCKAFEFRCNDGKCIDLYLRCDAERDCTDGSDEHLCGKGVCGVHQYRCANGICIPGSNVCDGPNDCGDSSDEIYCSRLAKR